MGSYNRLNGTYACQHLGILSTLKRAWGWEGFVAPDFLHAVRDPAAAANAGLDIPGLGVTEGRTAEDFASGRIPSERLDEIVRRILFSIFDAGLDSTRSPTRAGGRRWPARPSTSPWRAGSPSTAWCCSATTTACCRWTPGGSARWR
jgi:beta-glucosidase